MANPTGKGGFQKGQSGNPAGLTKEAKAARAVLRLELEGEEARAEFLLAYRQAIRDGNVQILIDYANRVMGKPKEALEVSGPDGSAVSLDAFRGITPDELRQMIFATDPKEKK